MAAAPTLPSPAYGGGFIRAKAGGDRSLPPQAGEGRGGGFLPEKRRAKWTVRQSPNRKAPI